MPNTFRRRLRNGGVIVATIGTVFVLGGPSATAVPPKQWADALVNLGLLPNGDASLAEFVDGSGTVVGQATTAVGQHHAVRWDPAGHITDLGTLPNHLQSAVTAMNNSGELVGYSNAPALVSDFAVRWDRNGRITSLAPAADTSKAVDINDAGAIAGQIGTLEAERAVRWSRDGAITYLPTLPEAPTSTSVGISAQGTVAGLVRSVMAGGPLYAARWRVGVGVEVLDTYQGAPGSMWPVGIDDSDAVYGTAGTPQGQRVVRWNASGDTTDLPQPSGASESIALQVTAGGTVLGLVRMPDGQHAARWDPSGALTVLDNAPGSTNGFPNGVNASGVVAGQVTMPDYTTYAAKWDSQGRITLLYRLPGGSYASAAAVDDRGAIVGYALTANGYPRAVRWPVNRRR